MTPLLPAFAPAGRLRPVSLVQADSPLGAAPYAAVESDLTGARSAGATAALLSGDTVLRAVWDGREVTIETEHEGRRRHHRSRRHSRGRAPSALALSLTGPVATAYVREAGHWVVRAVVDLHETPDAPDVHAEDWHGALRAEGDLAGGFGQLGLRDLRVVTRADGSPYPDPAGVLLSATSAGPGGFRTAHTSIWALDVAELSLTHRSDLFFRRPERPGVYGDHAVHVVRDDDHWLVAASTWGDFDRRHHPRVTTTLATSSADLLHGTHVLDPRPLDLPTDDLASVGTWDPHLVRTDDGWLVAFVSARRFFDFHPAIATGATLDDLTLRAADTSRTACEGGTLTCVDDVWWLLASDGRDSRRDRRATYPVLDLDLRQHGVLEAAYPTNLPWPTTFEHGGEKFLVGFDGTPYGGRLTGYGTHGDIVVQRAR